jgi:ElaB/YqjD/DUF883 family membrane-anchored ribosome-binding protein
MTPSSDDIERAIDDTRRRMDATQSAMTDKLEVLEQQIRETVQDAHSAVEDVVTNVKETISDTGSAIKRTFDVSYQTERHPWVVLSGSILVGYLLGNRRERSSSRYSSRGENLNAEPYRNFPHRKMTSGVFNPFGNEISSLKGAVATAVISALWKMAKQALSRANASSEKRDSSMPQSRGDADQRKRIGR